MRILGAVLAGGRSSRFGSDKALAPWQGRPLIEHCWDALGAVADERILCGRAYLDLPWIEDRPAAGLGPLGGLCAALHRASAHGFDRVVTIGCDTPSVPFALIGELAAGPGSAYVADIPVLGGWPAALASELDAFVASDDKRSVRGWATVANARAISAAPIPNINAPGDLADLRRD